MFIVKNPNFIFLFSATKGAIKEDGFLQKNVVKILFEEQEL